MRKEDAMYTLISHGRVRDALAFAEHVASYEDIPEEEPTSAETPDAKRVTTKPMSGPTEVPCAPTMRCAGEFPKPPRR